MRRRQKTKTVAIIALTISVLGLTLGFAAFSNVLTISSSATVTPDASDFKIALYGLPKTYEQQSLDWDDPNTLSLISSPETASPIIEQVNQYPASGSIGIIDGTSIKNLRAEFTGPDISVEYPIIIKNEGDQ